MLSLNWLLVFIPISLGLDYFTTGQETWVFITSALAIIPLASLMGHATENLASYLGSTVGGLLNASLGNAPELIIAGMALSKGLHDVVKASITGSILGNLLFGLGISMIAGGAKYQVQKFNPYSARSSAGLLLLAVIGLVVPSVFDFVKQGTAEEVSLEIAVVLFVVYILSLVFTLLTHKQLFVEDDEPSEEEMEHRMSKGKALVMLAVVTSVIALMSEVLTGALEPATESLGLTPVFAGVVLLALVGNVAESLNAVRFARQNKMELSFGIAVGASTQVVLLVAPVLVFLSYFIGHPEGGAPQHLDLIFTKFEVIAIGLTVLVVAHLTNDAECNWFEGAMLVGVYIIFAIGLFFLPVS